MYFWIVRFETRTPSFRSSPRMRSAPQSSLSMAIRCMSSLVSISVRRAERTCDRDLALQKRRTPSRCQRSTVSGFTRSRASRHRGTK
jgi:hypothetical protein